MWMVGHTEPVEPMTVTRVHLLTTREREIVALVARGYRNQQIAAALNISEQTVKNRLSVIFDKLQVRGRVRVALVALRHNIE